MNEPHIVKFSGGRSSGMMLMELLRQNALRPERGDVIVFNNTSAEHPATYDFTRKMKALAEEKHNIPFFWIEYQTYEDAGKYGWARRPSYRLVNGLPYGDSNKTGYHCKGEVFEELVSLTGFVPNMQSRLCTQWMKIFTTNAFLADWFAQKPGIERLGHHGETARMSDEDVVHLHQASRGTTPDEILLAKKAFVRTRDYVREAALWQNFTNSTLRFDNENLKDSVIGGKGQLYGEKAIEYVSYLGIRSDESIRVEKIRDRIAAAARMRGASSQQPPKERISAPLVDKGISQKKVLDFWSKQGFNLALPNTGIFSNCVYCPLKGKRKLLQIAASELADETDLGGTPASIDWWIEMESKYARDLKAEKRVVTSKKDVEYAYVGFFGAAHDLVYRQLKEQAKTHIAQEAEHLQAEYLEAESYVPCNCTD